MNGVPLTGVPVNAAAAALRALLERLGLIGIGPAAADSSQALQVDAMPCG